MRTTLLVMVTDSVRDIRGRQRLEARLVRKRFVTVVLLTDGRSARKKLNQGSESEGELSESLMALPPRRGMETITDSEGLANLHGSTPSSMIGQVDALFHIGGRSLDKTADRMEGWPTSDAGSTPPVILRALLCGTFTSAVGVPRGGMGPLLVAITSRACIPLTLKLKRLTIVCRM